MFLNCHTYYSLKYGTMSPDDYLAWMEKHGLEKAVLTDINNTSAFLDLLRKAKSKKISLIPGVDFRLGAQQKFIGIAKNNQGFQELNAFLSAYLAGDCELTDQAPNWKHVWVVYPWSKDCPKPLKSHEFFGLRSADLADYLRRCPQALRGRCVALHTASFQGKKEFNMHRLLRAIDCNQLLSRLPATEQGNETDLYLSPAQLKVEFKGHNYLVEAAQNLLNQCEFSFDFNFNARHNNLQNYTQQADLDYRLIRHLAYAGVPYRYGSLSPSIRDRIEKELRVIRDKGFVSYFLVAWHILKYARKQGYFYVGRGSGANSILSYLLRITDVDPLELDLYFERFINLFRQSPPDFDIDFSWKDREDVTRYIFNRFPNVCLLAAYSTFKRKSVVRELAKVFGLPEQEIKRLQTQMTAEDDLGRLVLRYSQWIQGFPSHLTVHSAGILISEKPIHAYTATFLPPKGFPTTHFDMHTAEDIGLYKFDVLGQRGLAKVKEAIALVRSNRNVEVDVHDLHAIKTDVKANVLLRCGEAIGCFYVESPAMRMLLHKLQVQDYLSLVAASSVIRPGVAQSGMMREYIWRHRDPKRRAWAATEYPDLYTLMPETYGVMVYQEDVIKVAHHFAGLSLAQADVLRRGMSGKYRSRKEFQEVKEAFFDNCRQQGRSQERVQEVWNQIESFAGYAFAKGHSASYAVESYQCLYLKAYFPIEFMVANINNGGGFYSKEIYLHEARKAGAKVMAPCVNRSGAFARVEGVDLILGLIHISGLHTETVKALLSARQKGSFKSLRDAVARVGIPLDQWILLIRSGAFDWTNLSKKELLWDIHFLIHGKKVKRKIAPKLFDFEPPKFQLPPLFHHPLESVYDEIELLGFPLSKSPFQLLKNQPKIHTRAAELKHCVGRSVQILAYLVHVKRTTTKLGDRMFFATFLDLDGAWLDVVVFPYIARRYPFRGPGCYCLRAKVVMEFDYISLELQSQFRLDNISLDEVQADEKIEVKNKQNLLHP